MILATRKLILELIKRTTGPTKSHLNPKDSMMNINTTKFASLVREILCQRGEAQDTHGTFLQNFFTFLQSFERKGGTHRNATCILKAFFISTNPDNV